MISQQLIVKENDAILIIAPHPDDESIGCGGILSLYPEQCEVVVVTDGRLGIKDKDEDETINIRRNEYEKAMKVLGIKKHFMLGYPDGKLESFTKCFDSVKLSKYTKVFVPSIKDGHVDHTAACKHLLSAVKEKECKVSVFQYEVHKPLHDFSHHIDITDVINKKKSAIEAHASQSAGGDYSVMMTALAKYRSCQLGKDDGYVEVYSEININSIDNEYDDMLKLESDLVKSRRYYQLLYRWHSASLELKGIIANRLIEKEIRNIVIYGYAEIGMILQKECLKNGISIAAIMDMNKPEDINVIYPSEYKGDFNIPIIVTATYYYDEIKDFLLSLGFRRIFSLEEFI